MPITLSGLITEVRTATGFTTNDTLITDELNSIILETWRRIQRVHQKYFQTTTTLTVANPMTGGLFDASGNLVEIDLTSANATLTTYVFYEMERLGFFPPGAGFSVPGYRLSMGHPNFQLLEQSIVTSGIFFGISGVVLSAGNFFYDLIEARKLRFAPRLPPGSKLEIFYIYQPVYMDLVTNNTLDSNLEQARDMIREGAKFKIYDRMDDTTRSDKAKAEYERLTASMLDIIASRQHQTPQFIRPFSWRTTRYG